MEEKQVEEGEEKKKKKKKEEVVVFEGKQGAMAEEEQKMKEYPAPLTDHKELCSDPGIFLGALRRFHSLMGTKFMIPVIGGKDLNLHLLYVEVTNRGGLEKVIVEKRWREVISIFNFPPTTTSASFVLRKYYLSLLHHFEQAHFFGVRGRLVPPAAALQTRSQHCKFDDLMGSDPGPAMKKKRPFPPAILPAERPYLDANNEFGGSDPAAASGRPATVAQSAPTPDVVRSHPAFSSTTPVDKSTPATTGGTRNFTVTGTIDGKFDYGYFVTVKIGSQLLHGVLYHINQHQLNPVSSPHVNPIYYQTPPPSSFAPATMENASVSSYIPSTRSAGRRRRQKNRDPARPKPNRSAYNFFFAEKHFELKAQCPNMEREYSKRIGECWSKLTDEERQNYEDYARRDKERYKRELQVYKERFKFFEETPKKLEIVRKEVARREMHDCGETIEIARSKEAVTHETPREGKVQDCSEKAKGKMIEEQPCEQGMELMNSAMESNMLNSDSMDVNTGS